MGYMLLRSLFNLPRQLRTVKQEQRRPSAGAYRHKPSLGANIMERAVAGGEDRIGALPDELLQYVMSFLLSRDAVRTRVLAKRWRTLWKSVPALRILDPESYDSATGSSTFVDELLRLRDPTPLNVCFIRSACTEMVDDDPDWDDMAFERMETWLQYAVSCQVQDLTVHFPLRVTDMTLVSSHLKRLDFFGMRFVGCSLVLSSCQVLEVLEISLCEIFADIVSHSLKDLYIGSTFDWDTRRHIFAPNLVGFQLDVSGGLTPFIHSMPSLTSASVALYESCLDSCLCGNLSCEGWCRGEVCDINYSIVLDDLSDAKDLQLINYDPELFIFRKDLKWRPMFSKLKTLVLNGWCVDGNFTGLVYFLQHSPILETLTLWIDFQTEEEQHVIETDECYNSSEQSFLSKHLKAVKIICYTKEDVTVRQILNILRTYGVPSEQIDIQTQ